MPNYLFDSNALIYAANPSTAYDALRELLTAPFPSGAASAISLVEVLGFQRLVPSDRLFLETVFQAVEIIPILDNIILSAINLGRRYGLKAANAVIAASAIDTARTLVSADSHFQRVPGLTVLHPLHIVGL